MLGMKVTRNTNCERPPIPSIVIVVVQLYLGQYLHYTQLYTGVFGVQVVTILLSGDIPLKSLKSAFPHMVVSLHHSLQSCMA